MNTELSIPDSSLCTKATELVLELSPQFLFNHSVRTYRFGGLLSQREGMKLDPELFYLASILHDIGLTKRCDHGHSFEVDGADAADEFLTQHGYPRDKIDIVREAIVLHTSLLAEEKQPEIALVHFGAGFDVGAFHIKDLPSSSVQQILEAYPRLGFKKAFAEVWMSEAGRKPNMLADRVNTEIGFMDILINAPFEE
ncbi:HD domain-containing protein [Paenibacillus durus]|uniref:Phosphohydrolase n=1 Tax=Paenibacillus durus TaxID=44251 RepID=A0A089IYZ8_PAEDU|nr:HD domain-containing protein [Paenibacillus durus]AIQ14184.1 phosphohydrolase [Paenibacillus durus]